MRRLPLVAVGVLTVSLLAGCGGTPKEDYCAAVKDHQTELTDIVTGGGDDALIKALPIFKDLQSKALSDVSDEWQQVVSRIEALQQALEAAGVDAASYDRAKPPEGLDADQRAAIDAAARELGSGSTLAALQGLDQEARDVCQTPLSL